MTADSLTSPKRALFLLSDTGGGHRAAADAICAALEAYYPAHYDFQLVDVFKCCTPFPYRYMPEIYPLWVTYSSITWQLAYVATDGRLRSRFFLDLAFITWRRKLRAMLNAASPDIVVCVHSLLNRAALHVINESHTRPSFLTVVTDLVSTPVSWYQKTADAIAVPTAEALERGLEVGIPREKLHQTGLPVHPDFVDNLTTKPDARRQLAWHPDKLAVLLVSGGDGMGPVYETAQAINQAHLDIQLAIVAGRNQHLLHRLQHIHWNQPTVVYPFVDFMATLMAGADIIITKAGPATIAEACAAGLPMILSGRVPGQEDGNVRLVVNNRAGVYAPKPHLVVDYLQRWLAAEQDVRDSFSEAAHRLAQPLAAQKVADLVYDLSYRRQRPTAAAPRQASWSRLWPSLRPLSANPPHDCQP